MKYTYKLIRSGRKTMSLEMGSDLMLVVRAPFDMPEEDIEQFVNSHSVWIKRAENRMKNKKLPQIVDSMSDGEIAEAKKRAQKLLFEKAAYYASVMGVKYSGIKITSAEKRLGSCSSKGRICFSYRVIFYPEKAIDYVVVHELAHLKYMNHSKRFYAFVEKYIPDYREAVKLIKEY